MGATCMLAGIFNQLCEAAARRDGAELIRIMKADEVSINCQYNGRSVIDYLIENKKFKAVYFLLDHFSADPYPAMKAFAILGKHAEVKELTAMFFPYHVDGAVAGYAQVGNEEKVQALLANFEENSERCRSLTSNYRCRRVKVTKTIDPNFINETLMGLAFSSDENLDDYIFERVRKRSIKALFLPEINLNTTYALAIMNGWSLAGKHKQVMRLLRNPHLDPNQFVFLAEAVLANYAKGGYIAYIDEIQSTYKKKAIQPPFLGYVYSGLFYRIDYQQSKWKVDEDYFYSELATCLYVLDSRSFERRCTACRGNFAKVVKALEKKDKYFVIRDEQWILRLLSFIDDVDIRAELFAAFYPVPNNFQLLEQANAINNLMRDNKWGYSQALSHGLNIELGNTWLTAKESQPQSIAAGFDNTSQDLGSRGSNPFCMFGLRASGTNLAPRPAHGMK